MLERILKFSIRQRVFVILFALGMGLLGAYNFQRLPIDALPDITNVQVQINTVAPGYSPLEAEQLITFPVEFTLAGLPYLKETRSISRYGLSQITAIFEDGTDIYFARQLLNIRLQQVKQLLPAGIQPVMGPIATGLGEIFMWILDFEGSAGADLSPFERSYTLRALQDWVIRPQMRNMPSVADVNTIGGYAKQYHVQPNPDKLAEYNLTFPDVFQALEKNNNNIGAGYLEQRGEQYLVRVPGRVQTLHQIGDIVIGTHRGVPIRMRDIGNVTIGRELRTGAATSQEKEVVLGTTFMRMGENSRTVSRNSAQKLKEINRTLPEGIKAKAVYDRTKLVNATLVTVRNNLMEGALFVIVVLFLLLGNFRAALITALVIPLSMLFAVTGMVENRISGNLLSLGAIDFGIIIDSAVIIVENCIRCLALEHDRLQRPLTRDERFRIVHEASTEVFRPALFGVIIIMIVYIPILTLTGIEGRMFRPMAFTVLAAMTGAMLLSLTFIPAMVAQFSPGKPVENQQRVFVSFRRAYREILDLALRNRAAVLALAAVLFTLSIAAGTRMGREFIPTLDEQDLAIHALRIPGTSLSQAIDMQFEVEKVLRSFPQVEYVFSKIGTAEIATDPMPPNVADTFVIIKPRKEWPDPELNKEKLIESMQTRLMRLPGNKYEFTQPIQMRFNELIAGVRADVAVKIFGDDLDVLLEQARRVYSVLQTVPGASDTRVEQVAGLPVLTVKLDHERMSRLGFNVSDIQDTVEIAIGGKRAGQIFEGDQRFDLVVRLPESIRQNIESLKRIPLPYPQASTVTQPAPALPLYQGTLPSSKVTSFITLNDVADLQIIEGPNQISRENSKRRVVVTANVRGRDLGSFVEEAENLIQEEVKLPPGYWISWGGQFEHMISAAKRLYVVVPVALMLIFILLFAALGSSRQALLVFSGVPLAWTGGVFALWIRGIPLSISAAVGFIALSGVAVLNGVVMISFINKLRGDGMPLERAIREGCLTRLRPVLMTALVASLGFLPMAVAVGTGAEVQRPLATVVIGGILSSTALTLLVLPVLYRIFIRETVESSAPGREATPAVRS